MTITPYLCVNDGLAAIDWYVSVLDAEPVGDPMMTDGLVGHAELRILGQPVFLSDAFDSAGVAPPDPARGNAVTLHLDVDPVDELVRRAVEAGAVLDRGPEDVPGIGRLAVLHDPFGHRWMLNQAV